jgi:polyisoprenoid-binding protein YceI
METWNIDISHSEIGFKVKHLMITNVKGKFNDFSGNINVEENRIKSIKLKIKTNSIDTNEPQRDMHLKSADFFDVENNKEIKFIANLDDEVEELDNIEGDLTIKGITNKVKLAVNYNGKMKDPWGNEKIGFSVEGKINRKDWELNWNKALETGGVLVGDEIKISGEVQLMK